MKQNFKLVHQVHQLSFVGCINSPECLVHAEDASGDLGGVAANTLADSSLVSSSFFSCPQPALMSRPCRTRIVAGIPQSSFRMFRNRSMAALDPGWPSKPVVGFTLMAFT